MACSYSMNMFKFRKCDANRKFFDFPRRVVAKRTGAD
jgi:hypothetical protein